ncbi:MAG: HAMP domain-containing histidine kinase [Ruminococcaceae bacterium]|nr:HAMP domain-containing histidine kinase [Oscillospiraceae bacterium]
MKFLSLTKRWFLNVASIIIVILIAVSAVLFFSLRNYYYSVADMALDSHSADEVASSFNLNIDSVSGGFEAAGRNYIDNFPDKDIMAVWIIDSGGNIVLSSSGFEINEEVEMPDFVAAVSGEGTSKWTGRLPSGEKIMASTCAYNYPNGNLGGAVRFMVSLEAIDEQLLRISLIIALAGIGMFVLVVFSGSLFIRSIVNPVRDIGETAKRIAGGDLAARIDHYPYNDEIGELCATINDMASKLSVSDRLKNDFISTISHELRTPLTAIKGWGETLLQIEDTDPAMTKRGMGVIISEASRLNDMVEELLDFSRMSSGRMQLNNDKIDILAELDEVVFAFKERSIKEGIEVVYNVPHFPAPMSGDASRIKQVFINILDNALKYTEHGGKIIVYAEIPNPATLIVTVSDTGAGIPPEDLPHVKEKFYKANTTVRGSGIGLAVADEIIRLHNGNLDVDSVLGEGTTVRITLPIDPVEYDFAEKEGENSNEQKEK